MTRFLFRCLTALLPLLSLLAGGAAAQCTNPPTLSLSTVDPTCGFSNGAIDVAVLGGTAPFSYQWTPFGGFFEDPTNLPPGTFCVVVTDAMGCTVSSCADLFDAGGIDTVLFTETIDTGGWYNVTTTVVGGIEPFTFAWSNGDTNQNLTDLMEGTYSVTVTDAWGCTAHGVYTTGISCPFNLDFTYAVTGNVISAQVTTVDASVSYQWTNNANNQTVVGSSLTYSVSSPVNSQLCLYGTDTDGCTNFACQILDIATTGADTISGLAWKDFDDNGLVNNGETGLQGVIVHVMDVNDTTLQQQFYTTATGLYSFVLFPGTYKVWTTYFQSSYTQSSPVSPTYYTVTVTGTQNQSGLNFGFKYQGIVIQGRVFYDANENGELDNGETGAAEKYVKLNGIWYWTDENGFFNITKPANNYTLLYDPSQAPYYPLTSQESFLVAGTTAGTAYGPYNFGISALDQDLGVTIIPMQNVVPGFYTSYKIKCFNHGLLTQGGNVEFTWDTDLTNEDFSPVPLSVTGNTVTWQVYPVPLGSYVYLYAYFDVPVSLPLGTQILQTATVTAFTGDDNASNNVSTSDQPVVGAFDPNDKAVSPAGQGPNGDVNPDHVSRLTYTVRFQNTGTYHATNVILTDTLSPYLDWNSLNVTDASHNYTAQFHDTTGTLKFFFHNIMLPDSHTNEPESHGYVQFEINRDSTLANLTTIENFVDIYFDFNEPVRTNTIKTTLVEGLSIHQAVSGGDVLVYPNPAQDEVRWLVPADTRESVAVDVFDVLGRNVATVNATNGKANLLRGKLPAGVYTYRVKNQREIIHQGKFVFE